MTVTLHLGNCLDVMRTMADNSVDSVITDPPYGLSDHSPAEVAACLSAWLAGDAHASSGGGFMGKKWDAWVPGPEIWREALRVLKPGGHLLAFAGTRSMDLMGMSLRLAGFELRDSIGYAHDGGGAPLLAWTYGSGFPKSLDVSKSIDKAAGHQRGTSADRRNGPSTNPSSKGDKFSGGLDRQAVAALDAGPETAAAKQWEGWGTALKPAWEPILLARKPLIGTVAANVQAHGTGALNIDGCRVATAGEDRGVITGRGGIPARHNDESARASGEVAQPHNLGRWPANLIHSGCDEVLAAFPDVAARGNRGPSVATASAKNDANTYAGGWGDHDCGGRHDPVGFAGSAARFFYCAKASKADRNDGATNNHPTVKPTDLMRYLCRLVTPPGGVVLDPFTGSGSTGRGAVAEGFRFIGIEMDPHYVEIARARIRAMQPGLPLEAA